MEMWTSFAKYHWWVGDTQIDAYWTEVWQYQSGSRLMLPTIPDKKEKKGEVLWLSFLAQSTPMLGHHSISHRQALKVAFTERFRSLASACSYFVEKKEMVVLFR
jgi:hypothetical protein